MMSEEEWDPAYHRAFVDLIYQGKVLGNKPGTKNLWKPLQQTTGVKFKKTQLKNHWDTIITRWKVWRRLVLCSAMKWDPVTKTFGASDQDWNEYLQVNPEAAQYRLNLPVLLSKLEYIFEGSNLDDEGTSGSLRNPRIKYTGVVTTRRSKSYWSPASHELFVDLLAEEAKKGYTSETKYPKESWRKIRETINKSSGQNYTRSQLRNHMDTTRKKWKIWCNLIETEKMKWDEKTRSFGATNADWEAYLKENPKAVPYRMKHVPHADKLATIFKGDLEPGKPYSRSYRKRAREPHSFTPPQVHDPAPLSTDYTNQPINISEDDVYVIEEHTQQRRRFDGAGDVEIVSAPCHRVDMETVESSMNAAAKWTIEECIDCLDNMEEVELGNDLYMFALDLFLKKEYREVFLKLKNSTLKMSWLLRRRYA